MKKILLYFGIPKRLHFFVMCRPAKAAQSTECIVSDNDSEIDESSTGLSSGSDESDIDQLNSDQSESAAIQSDSQLSGPSREGSAGSDG